MLAHSPPFPTAWCGGKHLPRSGLPTELASASDQASPLLPPCGLNSPNNLQVNLFSMSLGLQSQNRGFSLQRSQRWCPLRLQVVRRILRESSQPDQSKGPCFRKTAKQHGCSDQDQATRRATCWSPGRNLEASTDFTPFLASSLQSSTSACGHFWGFLGPQSLSLQIPLAGPKTCRE